MRGLKATVLPLILMGSFGSYAQASSLSEEVGRCIGIDNDIARLQCFDNATSKHFANVARTEAALKQWQVRTEVDPISDKVTTILVLPEKELRGSGYGLRYRNKLFVRCSHRSLAIGVLWEDSVGDASPRITSRIGSAEPQTFTWLSGNNPQLTFYPNNDNELLYRLLGEEELVIRLSRSAEEGGNITLVFDISGLREASKQLVTACEPLEPLFPY